MINTIIFDFGDIFINLDKEAPAIEFKKLGLTNWNSELQRLNSDFEIGKISERQFVEGIQEYIPNASIEAIRNAWNSILPEKPMPLYRLEFLQILSAKYRLFLLSNTDTMHIDKFQHKAGMTFYREFYQCFEHVYFSFETGMRKPDEETFNFIIRNQNLIPKHTLFIDDSKEHTAVAESLGLQVWNLKPGEEDVVDLFENKILFPI